MMILRSTVMSGLAAILGWAFLSSPAMAQEIGHTKKSFIGRIDNLKGCRESGGGIRYVIDHSRSSIQFTVGTLGITMIKASFRSFGGAIVYNLKNSEQSSVVATIQADSVDLGNNLINTVVRENILETQRFGEMKFVSKNIERIDENSGKIKGNFTMHGISHPATLIGRITGRNKNNIAIDCAIHFSAAGSLRRSDFGMTFGLPLIGDDIVVTLEIQGRRTQ